MKNKTKKTKQINLRLTQNEYDLLNSKAKECGKNASAFLLESMTNSEIQIDNSKDTNLLREQIRRVGNNINQIAHNLNKANKSDILDSVDYKDILYQLEIITNFLNRSYNECKA